MAISRIEQKGSIALPSQPFLSGVEKRSVLVDYLQFGDLAVEHLVRRVDRLTAAYKQYCRYYPLGIWAPGLIVSAEMHRQTELYLPLSEMWGAWRTILRAGVRVSLPGLDARVPAVAASWLDVLARLGMAVSLAPDHLLGSMLHDELFRERILFAWSLPRSYGGGFNRYPEQLAWLQAWLEKRKKEGLTSIRGLDVACGSGEGTYELAAVISSGGFCRADVRIVGETLHPVEVLAAALAHFPHNLARQKAYVRHLTELLPNMPVERIAFRQADLQLAATDPARYDLILCNGLLGGPLLHEPQELLQVLQGLVARLQPGGILLADDRFHHGWRQVVSPEVLVGMIASVGLAKVDVPSGVGGVRVA